MIADIMAHCKALLDQPEGKTVEFKRDFSSPKNILKTLVAFVNTAGGTLIIGVEDNKKVLGVDDPLKVEEQLTSLIADTIHPFLHADISFVTVTHKTLIVIEVPHLIGPFYLKKLGPEKGVMVRLGSSSRQASREAIAQIMLLRSNQPFDQQPCHGVAFKDLDKDKLQRFFKKIGKPNRKSTLKTLGILLTEGRKQLVSNGGVILFGKDEVINRLFPVATVSCARFSGNEKVDFIDMADFGNVMDAIDEVPKFIRRNTRMGAIIEKIRRQNVPEYAPLAIREGLLNAIMHADYAATGTKFYVSIFNNRLEIRNPGNLLPGVTVEDIKSGTSKIRNYVIARVFKELGLVETWGTGYKRITKASAKFDHPLPTWVENGPYTDICFAPPRLSASKSPSRLSFTYSLNNSAHCV